MKLLLCPFNWFHSTQCGSGVAGGEIYLHRLTQYLLTQGHEIKCIAGCKESYIHGGIEVVPQGQMQDVFTGNNELFKWCDVIVTQLLGNAYGYNKSIQHKKPLIFIAHNNSKQYAPRHHHQDQCHVVYNSNTLEKELYDAFGHFNGIVLHPLLPERVEATGNSITLVNCNHNKGGHIFVDIAKRLPQYNFIGVLGGYGEQTTAQLPNLTYLPNGTDMAAVYADTRVLLAPSEFESYSQAALEGINNGIPVIAHETKGLRENLGDAGIFISRTDIDKYCETIVYLMNDREAWQRQSDIVRERAGMIAERQWFELRKFNEWLGKIK